MKKYLSIFFITLQEYFVYRLNMFMWRVRQIFVFLLPYFLWRAVLGGGGDIYGYDFGSIMTYLFGTTILRSLVMGSRTVDLGWMINSGMLTIPLMRPINMFRFLLTRDAADKLFNLSFMFIEIPLIFLVFKPPVFLQTDPLALALTVLSIGLAILIYFYINMKLKLNNLSAASRVRRNLNMFIGRMSGIVSIPLFIIQPKSTVRLPITSERRIVVPKR
jgi:ABC-type uncharacterized transport system permease subunit